MQVTKSQKRLLIILGIVLLYAVYDLTSNLDTYKKFYSGKTLNRITKAVSDTSRSKVVKNAANERKEYLEKWGEDPFYILTAERKTKKPTYRRVARSKETLALLAISVKAGSTIALINDKIVKQGDIIDGYEVLSITKNSVLLDNGKKKITLVLKPY